MWSPPDARRTSISSSSRAAVPLSPQSLCPVIPPIREMPSLDDTKLPEIPGTSFKQTAAIAASLKQLSTTLGYDDPEGEWSKQVAWGVRE
ncbi:hypothetical protein FQN54_005720 [Arachnomyces sp. PD_36]|nr:hypothetical protein FQN54_005720 [Arachnomyces sp. PD_36]